MARMVAELCAQKRVVVDFRGLNSVLKKVDTAEDILSRFEGKYYLSIIDLA